MYLKGAGARGRRRGEPDSGRHAGPTWTRSGRPSSRWPRPASSARCWRSSRRASGVGDDAREYLAWLLQAFSDYPVAVELRHRSWSDHAGGGARRCCRRTAPRGCRSTSPSSASRSARTTSRTCAASTTCGCTAGTPRSGGRTIIPDERYNYLYSPAEIDGFADTVTRVRRLVQKIYVYMNNHFAGKAVANAAALRHAVGQPVPGRVLATRCWSVIRSSRRIVPRAGGGLAVRRTASCGGIAGGERTCTAEDAEPREG